jgi:ubiquinone biosynthesis protein COQ9
MSGAVGDRAAVRERLLLATLPHVGFDGWTERALLAGAKDCGFDAVAILRFFPGGPSEMVRLFSDWADSHVASLRPEEGRTHERVAAAVMSRLAAIAPYHEATRKTLAYFALPPHALLGLACLYRTVDTIWYAAGDRSADFSFYTKRALLAGVYAATVLYWLDDGSEGAAATRAFLDRRLADVMRFHRARGEATRFVSSLAEPVCRPVSKRRRA